MGKCPHALTDENRQLIEAWLLKAFASSTFNVCEHQALPLMTGPPLRLHIR